MKVYKYVLLGAALVAAQPSIAAVIKLGPQCNLYDAIRAANLDRRVRGCKAGRGADAIDVARRFSGPIKPYPTITSKVTLLGRNPIVWRRGSQWQTIIEAGPVDKGWSQGVDPPRVLFKVARGGDLTINRIELETVSVDVSGKFTLRNGGIHHGLGPAITGRPGSVINLDNTVINGSYPANIVLNRATLNARRSEIIIAGTGIEATDSSINLNNVLFDSNHVGMRLTRSTLVERNVRHNNIEQDVVTDMATTVVAPPVVGPAPVAPPISNAPPLPDKIPEPVPADEQPPEPLPAPGSEPGPVGDATPDPIAPPGQVGEPTPQVPDEPAPAETPDEPAPDQPTDGGTEAPTEPQPEPETGPEPETINDLPNPFEEMPDSEDTSEFRRTTAAMV